MRTMMLCAVVAALALPTVARAVDQPPGNGLTAQESTLYEKLKADKANYYVYSRALQKSDCNGEPSASNADCWRTVLTAYEKGSKTVVDPSPVNNQLDKIKDKDNNELIDGNTRKGTVDGTPDDKKKKRNPDPNKDKKDEKVLPPTDDNTTAKAQAPSGPANGPLTAAPAPPKEDPNKWNNTIAGVKGAIIFGVVGLILAGPMGMFLCAAAGFGAGYIINKLG